MALILRNSCYQKVTRSMVWLEEWLQKMSLIVFGDLSILLKINIHAGSLESYASIIKIIIKTKPDEIYHLGAQSYIDYAFKDEFSTINTNINGTHFLLSAIKEFSPKTKFYFAGSSEMFGKVRATPQNERTPFYPRSVYGISKVAGYDLTRNYREAYNLFCCSESYLITSLPEEVLNLLLERLLMLLQE